MITARQFCTEHPSPEYPTNRENWQWQNKCRCTVSGTLYYSDSPEQYLCWKSEQMDNDQPVIEFIVLFRIPNIGYVFIRKEDIYPETN